MEYIITFSNTSSAIKAESCLLAEGVGVSVMPLPGQIRAGCGICLRLSPAEFDRAMQVLYENSVKGIEMYTKTPVANSFEYKKAGGPHSI